IRAQPASPRLAGVEGATLRREHAHEGPPPIRLLRQRRRARLLTRRAAAPVGALAFVRGACGPPLPLGEGLGVRAREHAGHSNRGWTSPAVLPSPRRDSVPGP